MPDYLAICPTSCGFGSYNDERLTGDTGYAVTMALASYAHVRLSVIPMRDGLEVIDSDINVSSHFANLRTQEYRDMKPFAEQATLMSQLKTDKHKVGPGYEVGGRRLEFYPETEMPPSSGFGTSAAIEVAIMAALQEAYHDLDRTAVPTEVLWPTQLARNAHLLETQAGRRSGVMHYYASALGGITKMRIRYPDVEAHPVTLSNDMRTVLEHRLLIAYGVPQSPPVNLINQMENACKEDPNKQMLIRQLGSQTMDIEHSLRRNDVKNFGVSMTEIWKTQQEMGLGIVTDEVGQFYKEIEDDVEGFMVIGAGGRFSVLMMTKPGRKAAVVGAIREKENITMMPVRIDTHGLRACKLSA